jgi:DNA repair protein RecO (recombination protein O)
MDWIGDAIMCSVQPHGEHGAIARVLTPDAGLLSGYVKAGRSTKFRAMLLPGNILRTEWRMRVESQLGSFTLDMARSRADSLFTDRRRGAGMAWATSLVSTTVPERLPYPRLYAGLDALLETISQPGDDLLWLATLVKFELLVLAELGFGLDLSCCVATGETDDLIYVSPKSACAVSADAGAPYKEKLLALPGFLQEDSRASLDWAAIQAGLQLSGYFIERQLFSHQHRQKGASAFEARRRLMEALPVAVQAA